MLFGFWNRAKNVLMNGRVTWTKDEENKRRHELTAKALGREKSWSDLTNSDVDLIKAALLAIIHPESLNAQLRQQAQPTIRMRFGLRALMRELKVGEAYVDQVIHNMNTN